uniref:AraC-like ligand-binding domain-containing protein n=1 Tax=Ningiella ruwaisensis TaxID=2364274 RepID=UPI001446A02F|nr:helix-turn-helix domain-containing protein [Ningiella ruwaisensis]
MDGLINVGYQKSTSTLSEKDKFEYYHDSICSEYVNLDCKSQSKSNFFGEIHGGVGNEALRISEVLADAQVVTRSKSQIAKSIDAHFLISLQVSSQCVLRQSGKEAVLQPGSFALYDSTQPYTLSFSERFHQLVLQIPHDVLTQYIASPHNYTAMSISANQGIGSVLRDFICSMIKQINHTQQMPDELYNNLINMLALAFSSSLITNQLNNEIDTSQCLRQRILNFIDNNLCSSELNCNFIAESQGISKRYLYRIFQDEETSLNTLIYNLRLKKSAEILRNPTYLQKSIEWVAYSMGFVSASHFSRSFKKCYKMSPNDYRNFWIPKL